MRFLSSICFLALATVLIACAPAVQYESLSSDRAAKPDNCQLDVYPPEYVLSERFEVLGELRIGDTGLSVNCGLEEVTATAREKTCAQGADALQIIDYQEPDFGSTCYRLTAQFIAYNFDDWEKHPKTEEELVVYYNRNIDRLFPVEGIWTSKGGRYRIGVFRDDEENARDFVAVILRSDSPWWSTGDVKIEFESTAYSNAYTAAYYMNDHSRQRITATVADDGKLKFTLTNPATGDKAPTYFIKNYPANIGAVASTQPSPEGSGNPPSSSSSGSGFIVSNTGLVVTNYHVVEGVGDISVVLPDRADPFDASVLMKDESNDIAILKLESFSYEDVYDSEIPFSLADPGSVQVGQEVFTIGYPLGPILGKSAKLSDGIISSTYGIDDDPRLYQISTPIQPGNSGGPLFNRDGELVGIVVASLNARYFYERADIIPQNVNFAVKANYLSNVVSMLPESDVIMSRDSDLIGRDLEAQAAALTPFVVNIEAQ